MATQALRQINSSREGRFYELPDGTQLPSVTNVLNAVGKPALITWAANVERALCLEAAAALYADLPQSGPRMLPGAYIATLDGRIGKARAGERIKQKAADIGSQAHSRIEWWLRQQLGQKAGPEPVCSQPALLAFAAFTEWWEETELKPLWLETMVYSRVYGYAGTLDILAENRATGRVLVDVKTSKAIYRESSLQTAAYIHAVEEMGHGPVESGIVVRLPKSENDPGFETQEVEKAADHFAVFLNVLELWKWQHNMEERNGEVTHSASARDQDNGKETRIDSREDRTTSGYGERHA